MMSFPCVDCRYSVDGTKCEYHQEYYRNKARRRYRQFRQSVMEAYGNKCVCCGEDYSPYLELDHITGGGLEHQRLVGGHSAIFHDIIKRGFPSDYQILCANCHAAKTQNMPCKKHA